MNCTECGGPTFTDTIRGEIVCSVCSLVLDRVFDSRPAPTYEGVSSETVSFTNTGVPSTRFTNERRDALGSNINTSTRDKIKRLAWLNDHSSRRKDRSVKRLYHILSAACMKLEMNQQLRDRAFFLTKKAYEKGALANQEFSLLVGSTIMLALQESKRPMKVKDILAVLPVARNRPERQLNRAYRIVKRSLGLQELRKTPEMIVDASNLPPAIARKAREILRSMPERQKPEVDAAFAIFVAAQSAGAPMAQTKVAAMCGTTDISIRMRLRKSTKASNSPMDI